MAKIKEKYSEDQNLTIQKAPSFMEHSSSLGRDVFVSEASSNSFFSHYASNIFPELIVHRNRVQIIIYIV